MSRRPTWVYVVTLRIGPTDRVQPFGRAIAKVVGVLTRAGHDVKVTIEREPQER